MYHISGQPPVQYFNRLPRQCESDIAYILDPVVATAATIMSVVAVLKKVRSANVFPTSITSTNRLALHPDFIFTINSPLL